MIVAKWLGMAAIACTLCFVSCKPAQQQTEVAPIDDRAEILFETTMGNFKMALFNETPLHRDVYLVLAKVGYYDSLLFHRVIDNFVLQAGDPNSRYAKAGELLGDGEPFKIPAEIHFPKLYHKRGMVNAARQGDDTNPDRLSCGSQFAIMTCGPLTDAQIELLSNGVERIALTDNVNSKVALGALVSLLLCGRLWLRYLNGLTRL